MESVSEQPVDEHSYSSILCPDYVVYYIISVLKISCWDACGKKVKQE